MNTAKQVGQDASALTQKIARQAAAEPLEILKDAQGQISGATEIGAQKEQYQSQDSGDQAKIVQNQNELQDKARSARRMEALNQEIRDIHKQDLFNDLQGKISQGEEIPVADYPELSMEQKQVLKAQAEAYQNRKEDVEKQNTFIDIPAIHSKPSRRFGAGQKQEAERQQTRVEKPVPPSG